MEHSCPASLKLRGGEYKQSKDVIPAKFIPKGAGIQPFYKSFLDSCLRRSDNMSVLLFIQLSIKASFG
jgi:hypothetical protein